MSRNVLPDDGTTTEESSTRLFQLDSRSFGNIPTSVNLYRGQVDLPLTLADLPGRNGLALQVKAKYSSAVGHAATTWNATAPTGLLGLGWSLDIDQIVVDDKSTGNPLDGTYFLVAGGITERLEWYGSDGDDLLFQSRLHPLWAIRYQTDVQAWQVRREDGSTATYGQPGDGRNAVMYGVCWGNWMGASRASSDELRRYPVAWNLTAVVSPWGDGLTWEYENDEVEVAGGLTYTRASYVRQVIDMLGQRVRFGYLPKDPAEYVPPHQTADGQPDPAYQDRYETRALSSLEVSAGPGDDQLLYALRFGYELRSITDQGFTKRFLVEIAQERFGVLAAPPVRLGYQNDPAQPNPGALTSILFPEGGEAVFDYENLLLDDSAATSDIFNKNITAASPLPGSRPLVFHGPDYVVLAWYSSDQAQTLIQVYSFGGRWTQPWSPPETVPGRIQPDKVRFAAGQDFFALYLCPASAMSTATVRLFQKEPYRFGEWSSHPMTIQRSGTDLPDETALGAGDRFVACHLGGDWRVYRFWFDPVKDAWQQVADGYQGSTRIALAAQRNFYLVAWWDEASRTAATQVFHRDLTGTWSRQNLGGSGQRFDWDPAYAQTYWALGDCFAVATYLADGRPRLRLLRWNADYSLDKDEQRDARVLFTQVVGSLVGNGPLLLRFDGVVWRTFEMSVGSGDPRYAYGDDLAILSRVQGSTATSTVVAYDPGTATWQILSAGASNQDNGSGAQEQVWPPSTSLQVTTVTDGVYWSQPAGALDRVGTLPAAGAKQSLCNRGPSYLIFEDQPLDPTDTTASVMLFANGEIKETVRYPGQRSGSDDPVMPAGRLAGAQAFVTYPGGQSITRPSMLFLHRILEESLDDHTIAPVVSRVVIGNGYQSQVTRYSYDTTTAVPDTTGRNIQFAQARRLNGADGEGGQNHYSFYNGLPEPQLPALRRTSRAVLAESTDDYSLLSGMVREDQLLDADGYEVSATHSVWETLRLDSGSASPLGVLLPVAQPVLTREVEFTGKLRLFDLPAATAADLDSGVLSAQTRDVFAARGLPLSEVATVTVITAGERWQIIDGDDEYPVRDQGQALEVLGAIRRDTTNSYDSATGYLLGQEIEEFSSDGTKHIINNSTTPAWRIPEYADMKAARMLTAVAGETSTNITAASTVRARATTYRPDWPAPAPRVWAAAENYTWRGEAPLAPPFEYHPGAAHPDWVRDEATTARTSNGQPAVVVDVAGWPSSTLYDQTQAYPVAAFAGADLAAALAAGTDLAAALAAGADLAAAPGAVRQASYLGFESYEQQQDWRLSDGQPLSSFISGQDAHTGRCCLRLPGQSGGPALENQFLLPADAGRALLACWVKTAAGFPAGLGAGWQIELRSASGTVAIQTLTVPDTAGSWQQNWIYLDPPDPAQETAITCRLRNPVTGWAILLDDLRVTPVRGGVTARVYDEATHQVTAELDTSNNTTSNYYDNLLRQVATAGPGPLIRGLTTTCYSRRPGDDRYDPDSPNLSVTVAPAGQGFVEEFGSGAPWQDRWQASDPAAWTVRGQVLVHTATAPGTLTLRDSDGFAWYGMRVEFHAPADGTPVPSMAVSAGSTQARWDPAASRWQLLDAGKVVTQSSETTLTSSSWLLIAGRHGVMFLVDGRPVLSWWATVPISGALVLQAGGAEVGFSRVMVFHQPRLSLTYLDGSNRERQQQAMGEDGTVVSAVLDDPLGRAAVRTKAMVYPAQPPGYRPGMVTGIDWATGVLTGDLARYYSGGEHSDDQGYPYSRERAEAADTARVLEQGQPGLTLAIAPASTHTTRTGYAAKVIDGFLDDLPAGQYPVTQTVNPDGTVLVTITDQAGRTIGTRLRPAGTGDGGDPDGPRVSYAYDARGNLASTFPPDYYAPQPGSDPRDYVATQTADTLGRVISVTTCDAGTTEYVYDARGQVRFTLTAAGRGSPPETVPSQVIYTCYDRAGRDTETGQVETVWDRPKLQALADSDWPRDAPGWRERRSWDGDGSTPNAIGRVHRIERNLGTAQEPVTASYTYNAAGLVTGYTERPYAEEPPWQADYRYLGTGELAQLTYPHPPGQPDQALTVCYGYDPLGRMVTIGRPDALSAYASYGYDADGAPVRETLCPGAAQPVDCRYRYNSPGWRVAVESEPFTQTLSYWEAPGYGGVRYYGGQLARAGYAFGQQAEDYEWRYAYHQDGRLAVAENSRSDAYSLGTSGQPASYDANSNLLVSGDTATGRRYEYRPGTDLVRNVDAPGSDGYTYDPSGFTLTTPDPDHARIETDLVSGLTRTVSARDGSRVELRYGVGTRRLDKTRTGPDGQFLSERRYRTAAGDSPLTEQLRTGSGDNSEITYIYGAEGLIALVSVGTVGESTALVMKDHLKSARLLLGTGGEVLGRYDYRPFGDPMGQPTGSQPDLLTYRFTGQELDLETGLYNYRARIYDPVLYRFYSPDPAACTGSPYCYVLNDPVNFTDPSGAIVVTTLVKVAIGATVGLVTGAVRGAIVARQAGEDWRSGKFWAYVTIGAGTGAIAGGAMSAVSVLAGRAAAWAVAGVVTERILLRGVAVGVGTAMVLGGAVGAVQGAGTQLLQNQVSGSGTWTNVGVSAAENAVIQAATGVLMSTPSIAAAVPSARNAASESTPLLLTDATSASRPVVVTPPITPANVVPGSTAINNAPPLTGLSPQARQ